MAIDLLDAPLRLTWTMRRGRLDEPALLRLAGRLADAGLFFVTLRGDFARFPRLADLLAILLEAGVQVTVQADIRDDELPKTPVGVAWQFDLTAALLAGAETSTVGRLIRRRATKPGQPHLALVPLRPLLPRLPEVLELAGREGIGRLVLPNVPLVDDAEALAPLVPDARDLASFRREFERRTAAGFTGELVVHDLFLWEILCPGRERDHYVGCQAGNSLAHLDAAGHLHPCISWPRDLGSLLDHSLHDLWQAAARSEVLAAIGELPADCRACAICDRCHGGCRGLALTLPKDAAGRDLLCDRPRR
ncbi:GeoRSP system SPASM domain protein [Geothermobacter ehrlichii]|uniref:GeoRSP system SPASM domain protein n=1 Tax=Geothermobacter ehrlichii TaxID=213224 RepID=A0A5D3WMP5_9BACT|nr:SPASM domain-containing protein [Geothermobacter ehrlichii]TYO99626.1 GeoRSP system SPASM domain protein [Geothermobacter ehrlichii]